MTRRAGVNPPEQAAAISVNAASEMAVRHDCHPFRVVGAGFEGVTDVVEAQLEPMSREPVAYVETWHRCGCGGICRALPWYARLLALPTARCTFRQRVSGEDLT